MHASALQLICSQGLLHMHASALRSPAHLLSSSSGLLHMHASGHLLSRRTWSTVCNEVATASVLSLPPSLPLSLPPSLSLSKRRHSKFLCFLFIRARTSSIYMHNSLSLSPSLSVCLSLSLCRCHSRPLPLSCTPQHAHTRRNCPHPLSK